MLQKYQKLLCVILICITLIAIALIARDTVKYAAELLSQLSVHVSMH